LEWYSAGVAPPRKDKFHRNVFISLPYLKSNNQKGEHLLRKKRSEIQRISGVPECRAFRALHQEIKGEE